MWTDGNGYFYVGDCREGDSEATPAEIVEYQTPTQEQSIANLSNQIQKRLDGFAQTRNYDGILSACTYATSAVPKFAAEAATCVALRDQTWTAAYAILAEVTSGQRPVPSSIADFEAELPVLEWPNA